MTVRRSSKFRHFDNATRINPPCTVRRRQAKKGLHSQLLCFDRKPTRETSTTTHLSAVAHSLRHPTFHLRAKSQAGDRRCSLLAMLKSVDGILLEAECEEVSPPPSREITTNNSHSKQDRQA